MSIGDKLWSNGVEVTVSTEIYLLYGHEYFDATRKDGTVVTIPSAKHKQSSVQKTIDNWNSQQKQFSNLRKTNNE